MLRILLVLLVSLFCSMAMAADGVLSFIAAPSHSAQETAKLYTPLVEFLSETTGQQVKLVVAKNFISYNSLVQNSEHDLYFDGPHYTSWRMVHNDYQPLVRFPGHIRIAVAARNDSNIKGIHDLASARAGVCAFGPPNLLTMIFLSHFDNPIQQPKLKRVKGFKNLESCLEKGDGQVAVLRDKFWDKLDQTDLHLLPVPEQSYPERTVSIRASLNPELQAKIKAALLSPEAQIKLQYLFKRFNRESFVSAHSEEYSGSDKLLATVWGFR